MTNYNEFQIRLKDGKYGECGTTFGVNRDKLQKSSTSVDGNPLIFTYKNLDGLIKSVMKHKTDDSEFVIMNNGSNTISGCYSITVENLRLIQK